jgi:hypothetical protein
MKYKYVDWKEMYNPMIPGTKKKKHGQSIDWLAERRQN